MGNLVDRSVHKLVLRKLAAFPVVGIVGPRQVGKTTLVREQLFAVDDAVTYLDLENPRDLLRLDEGYDFLESRAAQTVVIDEVQVRPELFTRLRPLVDADRRPGRFVLLGSASPTLIRGASESLAGRVSYCELSPLTLDELPDERVRARHWLRGGYPAALLTPDDEGSFDWRVDYLETYITRELPALGAVGQVDTLRRLCRMLAAQQGELLNQSTLARSLGTSQPTVRAYVDLLERSFLVRRLRPYAVSVRKRLVKSPKVYVRDSGLLHALARVETAAQLRDDIAVGASWEGYVVEQIANVVSPRAEVYFYRTQAGAEIDLVIIGRRGRMACVEVKLSSAPKLTRGFYNALEDLGPERTFVVATVAEPFRLAAGVEVCTLTRALDELAGW